MKGTFDLTDNRCVVEALKLGNKAVFEAVYKAYNRPLRAYAAMILQDAETAYEVVQDIFVAVWLHRKRLDETKSLRNYLLRSVHNNALHLLKAEMARKLREEKAVREELRMAGEGEEPVRRQEWLIAAMARLPEQSRRVLEMSYWEEKKSAEIARELSISIRTVETILYKVKKKLRGEIKKN